MRSLEHADVEDLAELNAQPWMLELLKLNPAYNNWGPGEDAMCATAEKNGWSGSLTVPTWAELELELDDLNEVVNFHFQVERASKGCEACSGRGYNPATQQVEEDFYDFAGTGGRWNDRITTDEAVALRKAGRDYDFKDVPDQHLAEAMNRRQRARGMGHDAINRHILIEARARRLGVFGLCSACDGEGSIYTEPAAHVELVLWVIHPRKGASRGLEVKRLEQEDVPAALAFLKEAAERNAERFARVVAQAEIQKVTP